MAPRVVRTVIRWTSRLPVRLRHRDADLTFFSTITTFGAAFDLTLDEIAVEAYFPADDKTAAYLRDSALDR